MENKKRKPTMTNEQIEEKIKELQEMKKENIKIQKQKERQEQQKTKAKNDKKMIALMRLLYDSKTDEEILEMWVNAIREKAPDKLPQVEKILSK